MGYNYAHLRRWLRGRGIRHRIARKGVESSQRLGRHPWVAAAISDAAPDASPTADAAKPWSTEETMGHIQDFLDQHTV